MEKGRGEGGGGNLLSIVRVRRAGVWRKRVVKEIEMSLEGHPFNFFIKREVHFFPTQYWQINQQAPFCPFFSLEGWQ